MSLLAHLAVGLTSALAAQDTAPESRRTLHLTGPYRETTVADASVWIVDAAPWESALAVGEDELIPWIRRVGRRTRSDAGGRVELLPGERPFLVHAETATLVSRLPTASSQVFDGPWQYLARDNRGDVWLDMIAKGPVEVLVLDATGRPVADCEVRIPTESSHPPDYDESLTSARTDEAGLVRLPWAAAVSTGYAWRNDVREGAFVRVTLPLQASVRAWVPSGQCGTLQLPPTLDLVVHLQAGGGVLELERDRRPGEPVSLWSGSRATIVERLGRVRDGMVVRNVPFTTPVTVRVLSGSDLPAFTRVVDPAEAEGRSELHIELPVPDDAPAPVATPLLLSGQLLDVDGRPLVGGRLRRSLNTSMLDASGRFAGIPLRPGAELSLTARAPEGGRWYRYTADVPDSTPGVEVDLGALYPVRQRPLVAGVVVDGSGRPVAAALVRIFDAEAKNASRASRFTSTDARGRFFWPVGVGTAAPTQLSLTAAEGGRHARWIEVAAGDAEAALTLLPGGIVRATLPLEEGAPTVNLVAELEGPIGDPSAYEPHRRVPFADGGFEFSALPEGTYALGLYALGTERPIETLESLQVIPGKICERELIDEQDPTWRVSFAELLVVGEDGVPIADATAWLGPSEAGFNAFAPVASSAEARIRIALHPGVPLGTEFAFATVTARDHRSQRIALVPGEQRVVLPAPSALTIRFGDALARERASSTIQLFRWSEARGSVRLLAEHGSPKSGAVTFAVDDPGPWEPRWVENGRAWSLENPSATGNVRYGSWLEVPDEGLELRLGD